MRYTMALASLVRRPARSLLAVAGVAVAAAMLLDMVMLSSGMRESFREALLLRGFEIRLSPRGTLPFDTDASVANAGALRDSLLANPDIRVVSPLLGSSINVTTGDRTVTAVGLGLDPEVQGDYEVTAGLSPRAADEIVINRELRAALGVAIGDEVLVAVGYDPQLAGYRGQRTMRVSGEGRFLYMAAEQRAAALQLETLQGMYGADRRDRVSIMMLDLAEGADGDRVSDWINASFLTVNATSIAQALRSVDERLSYFRQLAFILGSVSLAVGFLLITTLVTISVNERVGEIAVMRAIGVSRAHVLQQILVEALALTGVGIALGVPLGLATARYLNSILAQFPGLPAAIDFFYFQPGSIWRALALLLVAGVLAAIYPAWRSASLPVAGTLRREAVA